MRLGAMALALVFCVQALPNAQFAAARVSGRVVDESGATLPGVTITVGEQRRQSVTDAQGRFEIDDLPTGTYTITATLPSFQIERRTLRLRASGSVVNFTLAGSCVADTLSFTRPPLVDRRLLARSDLVVHLVLDAPLDKGAASASDSRSRYRATVLRALTRPRNGKIIVRTIDVLLNPYADFEIGSEYVVWLTWRADRNAFDGGYPIPGVVRLVEQGRVKTRGCAYSVDELFDIFEDAWENASR
jgi:Carboxypeptidase regulatory-like domain